MKNVLLFTVLIFSVTYTKAQIITTVAGDDSEGYNGDNIPAVTAELDAPIGIAVDDAGNIYVGDRNNNRVRKINTSGIITTIAGTGMAGYSGDGSDATNATLNEPFGVAVDNIGNVYFADCYNHCIRKINALGIISTIAGIGTAGYNGDSIMATTAKLHSPSGVAIDAGDNIYIADGFNNRIRKVNTLGIITTVGGTGAALDSGDNAPATAAGIFEPYVVTLDVGGNIYIGEQGGNSIRKINTSGIITTIAGTGTTGYNGDNIPATMAELNSPSGIAIDPSNNIFIADAFNNRIRKINPSGIITTYAGTGSIGFSGDGGLALDAELSQPVGLAFDNAYNLYISDFANNRIRHITSTLSVNTFNASTGKLIVYPNPSHGDFTIGLPIIVTGSAHVIIANPAGGIIREFTTTIHSPPINVNLDEPPGVYFISVTTPSGIYNAKLVLN